MFQIKSVEKIQTKFYAKELFLENRAVYEIMWKKYGAARQNHREKYNKVHALCMLDN
jgi:hypothetical protein